jgi:acyl-coenzyme A synthetase/AMP-(fatty) acid ligase
MHDLALNITFSLLDQARFNPGSDALVYPDGVINYRDLNTLAWNSAQFLHDAGIRKGIVVTLHCAGELSLAVAILGLTRLGAPFICVPKSAPVLQQADWAASCGSGVLLTDRRSADAAILPRTVVLDLRRIAAGGKVDPRVLDPYPEGPWMFAVGSGSTGKRKVIPVHHEHIRARCHSARVDPMFKLGTRLLCMSHLSFSTIIGRLFYAIETGAAFVMMHRQADDFAAYLARNRVSVLRASVFDAEQVLAALGLDAENGLGFLDMVVIGGSTVSGDLRRRVRRAMNETLQVSYGTNECHYICRALPPEVYEADGGVGHPVPGVTLEVVDEHDRAVPAGVVGRVRVRSAGVVRGYLNDEAATARAFSGGWFYPGDMARLTDKGALIHCGRSDGVMIFDGINIYPVEIEECLARHPAVREAACFPMRDQVHQDIPICAVALVDGARASEAELHDYARERLGHFGPRRVVILPRIPRNEQGKIVRAELFEMARAAAH